MLHQSRTDRKRDEVDPQSPCSLPSGACLDSLRRRRRLLAHPRLEWIESCERHIGYTGAVYHDDADSDDREAKLEIEEASAQDVS